MLINRQPPPYAGMVELTASRIWLTNVYKGVYFNEQKNNCEWFDW